MNNYDIIAILHCIFLLEAQFIITAREETVIHLKVSLLTVIQYLLCAQHGPSNLAAIAV